MAFRRKGFRRQSIRRRDDGQVEGVLGMFLLLILCVLVCAQLQMASWRAASLYLEDALAASNLASALIDVEEYGKTHRVMIKDAPAAYAVYCNAVRENLQLDENWLCGNKSTISGPVEIADYVIYNVKGDRVTASRVGRQGAVTEEWSGARGAVKAPDGTVVECTGIYSEIAFPVKSFFGLTVQAHKGKLADIWTEKEEEDHDEEENGDV